MEEVLEIASKTNENLKEENLRLYIERNLEAINSSLETSFLTVDDVVKSLITKINEIPNFFEYPIAAVYENQYLQTYFAVAAIMDFCNIELTYDILFPEYLLQNMFDPETSGYPYAYWTFSTYGEDSQTAWTVEYYGNFNYEWVFYEGEYGIGICPVITVSKSKLNK